MPGFDAVLAVLGNHGIKKQPSLISTALSAGVKRWYPSEFGADLTVGDNWKERYYRDKVLTREYLEKNSWRASRICIYPFLKWATRRVGSFAPFWYRTEDTYGKYCWNTGNGTVIACYRGVSFLSIFNSFQH